MSSGNQVDRVLRLQTTIGKLVLDGKRNPERVADILQDVVDTDTLVLPRQDPIVRVNRSVRPLYPDWIKDVSYKDLESVGANEYNARKDVGLWLHDGQVQKGRIIGHEIRDKFENGFKRHYGLGNCLGLHDAMEMQKRGCVFFEEIFGPTNAIFFWKSVVVDANNKLFVPGLYKEGYGLETSVYMTWRCLDEEFYYCDFAVGFGKDITDFFRQRHSKK